MSITHQINHEKKTLTISISGQFNFSAHPSFRASYIELDDLNYSYIVDLRNTDNMDSAALGMLLLLDENNSANHPVKIINANEQVRQVLAIAHFDKKFDIV